MWPTCGHRPALPTHALMQKSAAAHIITLNIICQCADSVLCGHIAVPPCLMYVHMSCICPHVVQCRTAVQLSPCSGKLSKGMAAPAVQCWWGYLLAAVLVGGALAATSSKHTVGEPTGEPAPVLCFLGMLCLDLLNVRWALKVLPLAMRGTLLLRQSQ